MFLDIDDGYILVNIDSYNAFLHESTTAIESKYSVCEHASFSTLGVQFPTRLKYGQTYIDIRYQYNC